MNVYAGNLILTIESMDKLANALGSGDNHSNDNQLESIERMLEKNQTKIEEMIQNMADKNNEAIQNLANVLTDIFKK